MKALIQRVSCASVSVDDDTIGKVSHGFLVFLGVCQGDTEADISVIATKILSLRVFADASGKMNHSIVEASGSILLVSQFTLCVNTKKGNRPSFTEAAPPLLANKYYEHMKTLLSKTVHVETGKFAAYMRVSLTNDGPVTIMLDSRER